MKERANVSYHEMSENINGRLQKLQVHKYGGAALEIILETTPFHYRKKWKTVALFVACSLPVLLSAIGYDYGLSSLIYALVLIVLVAVYRHCSVERESLLVVRSLGYQIEKSSLLGTKLCFIPWHDVITVFINEVVSKQRVVFVLEMLIRDSNKQGNVIVPLFTGLMPRLHFLEIIYRTIQDI